jgi:hypothetical protein
MSMLLAADAIPFAIVGRVQRAARWDGTRESLGFRDCSRCDPTNLWIVGFTVACGENGTTCQVVTLPEQDLPLFGQGGRARGFGPRNGNRAQAADTVPL